MLDDEDDTNHLKSAIAIGESPHSGNYFAMTRDLRATVAEMLAFAQSWQERRRELLKRTIDRLLVIPISDRRRPALLFI